MRINLSYYLNISVDQSENILLTLFIKTISEHQEMKKVYTG